MSQPTLRLEQCSLGIRNQGTNTLAYIDEASKPSYTLERLLLRIHTLAYFHGANLHLERWVVHFGRLARNEHSSLYSLPAFWIGPPGDNNSSLFYRSQPTLNLIIAGKAGAYPCEAYFMSSTLDFRVGSRDQCYKTFSVRNLRIFAIS